MRAVAEACEVSKRHSVTDIVCGTLTCVTVVHLGGEIVHRPVEVVIGLPEKATLMSIMLRRFLWHVNACAYLEHGAVNPSDIGTDIRRRLLERRRGIQIEVLERVEVEDTRDDRKHVLPQCLIEREGLEACESLCGDDERLARKSRTWVRDSGGSAGEQSLCSDESESRLEWSTHGKECTGETGSRPLGIPLLALRHALIRPQCASIDALPSKSDQWGQ